MMICTNVLRKKFMNNNFLNTHSKQNILRRRSSPVTDIPQYCNINKYVKYKSNFNSKNRKVNLSVAICTVHQCGMEKTIFHQQGTDSCCRNTNLQTISTNVNVTITSFTDTSAHMMFNGVTKYYYCHFHQLSPEDGPPFHSNSLS